MVPMGSAAQVNGEVRVDLVDLVAADHLARRSGAVNVDTVVRVTPA